MHPNPRFRRDDDAAMRGCVATPGFAHLCIDGPVMAHVPVTVTVEGRLRFHLARANRLTDRLDGAPAIASVSDADHYVSPGRYGSADQVPTWNYVALEVESVERALDDATLAPQPAWTRAKMTPDRLEAMMVAIRDLELVAEGWLGTAKPGQNKTETERAGVEHALMATGRVREAAMVRAGVPL